MARARKIERFLSQPFHVAEVFTGSPGVFVELADTIKGFKGRRRGFLSAVYPFNSSSIAKAAARIGRLRSIANRGDGRGMDFSVIDLLHW